MREYKFFDIKKCASPDISGSEFKMNECFLDKIEQLGCFLGKKLSINSGYRSVLYNSHVGGSKTSSHLKGFAVDIHCPYSRDKFELIKCAIDLNFSRIGVYNTFIHIDNDPDKPHQVLWVG